MKKFLTLCACALAMASCAHDDPEYVDMTSYSYAERPGTFEVLRESDLDLADPSLWGSAWGEGTKATSSNMVLTASNILSTVISTKVHQVVGTYMSTDIHGKPIKVSGKIIYPKNGEVKNMMLVSHFTIGSNAECPSESFSFESLYAALGYAVVISDYIGFGVTVKEVHPYLQAETCSRNVIDFGIAARPFLKDRGLAPKSSEVVLLGYSQGGATTLHVQRLIETYKDYEGVFKVKINYAGSGPYNIARTYDYCIKRDVTGIPCAVPMIIQGMSIGMDKPLDMSFFFREPLLSHYDDWLNSKKYTVGQISEKIGSDRLSEILTKNATDRSNPETARFYKELMNNSIPPSFIPGAPLFMFHSEDDQTVPFVNSQLMQRQFRYTESKIEYDFGHYGDHQQGALKFILKVAKKLD